MNTQRLTIFDGLKSWSVESAPEYAWTRSNLRANDSTLSASMAYRAVGAMFRGVQLRANAVARMPRYLYRGSEPVPEDDPALDFIGNLTDLLWKVEASLCLYAAAYIWKARNLVRLRELRWFATHTITPDTDPNRGLLGFRRSIGNIPYYQPDELAHIWLPSVDDEIAPGVAPGQAALISAGLAHNINVFASAFFERGAVKPILLYSPEMVGKEQKEEFETWAERMITGIRNAFRLRVMRFKVEKIDIADKLTDTIPTELPGQVKEDIATALGIPYSLLFSDAANYATAAQDDKHFYDKTIIPELDLIASSLNAQVFEPLGYELYFAPEELEVYQANEADRSSSLNSLTLTGVPVDVAMEQLGYDLSAADMARIRLQSFLAQEVSYENARAYILDHTEDDDTEEVTAMLDLFAPAPEPEPAPVIPPITMEDGEQPEQPVDAIPPDAQPNEAQSQTAQEDEDDDEPMPAMKADLDKWQRKALKRLRGGKPAACEFESEHIGEGLAAAIAGALEASETADEVKHLFSAVPTWEVYP